MKAYHGAIHHKGFTLIEVLVALIIVVISFSAMLITLNSLVNQQAIVQNKMLCMWVADNIMAQLQLNKIPALKQSSQYESSTTMANKQFNYVVKKISTQNQAVVKYEINVTMQDSGEFFSLISFGVN